MSKRLNILKCIKFKVDKRTPRKLHRTLILCLIEYAYKLRDGCTEIESNHQSIEPVQYEAA